MYKLEPIVFEISKIAERGIKEDAIINALNKSMKVIDLHVADSDLTSEMISAYNEYTEALKVLNKLYNTK